MNILISQRHSIDQHGVWVDSLENTYIKYFSKFNAQLFPVSNISKNINELFHTIKPERIILTGGGAVDPELFGANIKNILGISKQRDFTERELIKTAINFKIPILGICRGMQFINVFFGGMLTTDITSIDVEKKHKTPGRHDVRLISEKLSSSLKQKTIFSVNSYHNHGIIRKMLSPELKEFVVFDELNLIEGFYHPKLPIIGIQWHPEREETKDILGDKIIKQFLLGNFLF